MTDLDKALTDLDKALTLAERLLDSPTAEELQRASLALRLLVIEVRARDGDTLRASLYEEARQIGLSQAEAREWTESIVASLMRDVEGLSRPDARALVLLARETRDAAEAVCDRLDEVTRTIDAREWAERQSQVAE